LIKIGQFAFKLPVQIDDILTQAQRGNLTVQASLAPDTRKMLHGLERAINRLVWIVAAVGVLIVGNKLLVDGDQTLIGSGVMFLAALIFLWGMTRK
jgi:hypothetical protein